MEDVDRIIDRLGIRISTDYEGDRIYLRVTLTYEGREVDSDSIALPVSE